jgi:formamidopyrimidine-DNA glycosylase
MPELPEVETMCRCIAAAVGGRISDVVRPKSRLQSIIISPSLEKFRRQAVGRTITAVHRVGKRVVLELDDGRRGRPRPNSLLKKGTGSEPTAVITAKNGRREVPVPLFQQAANTLPKGEGTAKSAGECIVLEPRMTGLVLLADPPDQEHLRLIFHLRGAGAKHILFWDQRGLGVARLLSPVEFLRHYGPGRLGPDALTITVEMLRQRLAGSRRPIKVALLDQQVLAGVGNLYASEILHLAGIHPALPCRRVRGAQWSRLHAAMGDILQAAIRHQGSTLRDGTYRIARNQSGDYQVYHRVYQRTGESCLKCGSGHIVRIVQAQRSTFFCPNCQRRAP